MITVVSHDAGGAEVVSSFVKQQNLECNFILDGPAVNIFARKLGNITNITMRDIVKSDGLLCGSSWASELELQAIQYAKSINKQTTVFLEHWVNYKERFIREGVSVLPDNILVGDIYAEKMARKVFPGLKVTLVDNPYFLDLYNDYKILIKNKKHNVNTEGITVLYVCEPMRDHAFKQHQDERYWGYTEEDAINYFFSNIHALKENITNIVVRLHPSEKNGKYDWVMDKFNLPICIDKNINLIESVVNADIVVGCESMAMVVGLIAEKKVISTIPINGRKCVLPHSNILHLQYLLAQV